MTKTKIGRVALVPQGAWSSATQYAALDVVTYENDSWVAKQASKGVVPAEGDYWQSLTGGVTASVEAAEAATSKANEAAASATSAASSATEAASTATTEAGKATAAASSASSAASSATSAASSATGAASAANTAAQSATSAASSATSAASEATSAATNANEKAALASTAASAADTAAANATEKAQEAQALIDDSNAAQLQAQITANDADIATNATRIVHDSKRISVLEAAAQGITHVEQVDATTAYTKDVPSGALGYASVDAVGGKTVVWNQLWEVYKESVTSHSVTFTVTDNNLVTVSGTSDGEGLVEYSAIIPIAYSHKLLVSIIGTIDGVTVQVRGCNSAWSGAGTHVKSNKESFIVSSDTYDLYRIYMYTATSGTAASGSFRLSIFDLTAMFGSGNEPSTVAEFRAMFPADYYPYSANMLLDAAVDEVVSVGKNMWDEQWESGSIDSTNGIKTADSSCIRSKNPTYVQGSTAYYVTGSGRRDVYEYGSDGAFIKYNAMNGNNSLTTQSATAYLLIRFLNATSYADDTAVIKGTSGTYSPYMTASLPIPASLRSALPLYGASAGNYANKLEWVVADDGGVSCRYSQNATQRAYQDGDANSDTMTTDGSTWTNVALSTPVETDVTASLPDNLLQVEAGGTVTLHNVHGDTYRIPVPSTETYEVSVNDSLRVSE